MLKINPAAFEWDRKSKTRMFGRFQIGHSIMNVVAIQVKIVSGAFLSALHRDDDHYLRIAHELMITPGMPETVGMFGKQWLVLSYPTAETR